MPPTISVLRVEDATGTIGFVERAGSVYVSLKGAYYSQATEVAQSLSFDRARAMLLVAVGRAA